MKFILRDKKVSFCSPYPTLAIAGGEKCKTLKNVEKVWQFLLEHQATRHDTLVCVGGGSISDLGGFAAATYKRGMRWEVIPTTLLSMVDASIGGKTGINFAGLKNSVGVIAKPIHRLTDSSINLSYLESLPYEQFLSGMGEVIKTCLLGTEDDFYAALRALEDGHIDKALILRCRAIKEDIVRRDPKEKNIRKALNLGHTIGHALEEHTTLNAQHTTPNTPLSHGRAVLYGLVAELYLSVMHAGMDREPLRILTHLMIEHYGKLGWSCKDYDVLLQRMREDKKNLHAGEINFTLLHAIGQPCINQVLPEEAIKEALEYLFTV